MDLRFLGCGACFYPSFHNTSAYFVYNNNLILLDCGETVYERLLERENLNDFDQIYIVLTHLHADHVGSIGSMLSYCKCILNRRIIVVHPEKTIIDLLKLLGIEDDFYYYVDRLTDEIEGLHITPHKVQHVPNMICYGYEIEGPKGHVYYSGDSVGIPEEVLRKFFNGEIEEIYQDTSTHNSEKPTHMYLGTLEEMIPKSERNRITCMHLDCDCKQLLKDKGFKVIE